MQEAGGRAAAWSAGSKPSRLENEKRKAGLKAKSLKRIAYSFIA